MVKQVFFLFLVSVVLVITLPTRTLAIEVVLPHEPATKRISELLSKTTPQYHQRVKATLDSFAALSTNAESLSHLETPASLVKRVKQLFKKIRKIPTPNCHEVLDPHVTQEMIQFQKINRTLFQAFDDQVVALFRPLYPEDPAVLTFPIVEWAVNVMPNFTLDEVHKEHGKNLKEKITHFILNHYHSESLRSYLAEAWSKVELWNQDVDGKGGLLDRLRSDMCYPVRLSSLETTHK